MFSAALLVRYSHESLLGTLPICDMEVYQVGKVIKERFPVLESYDMTLEASVTKMMWALGQTRDMEKFKELFYTTINHDLLFL